MTDNMVNQGMDAIMASPISDANLTASIEAANEAGVATVNVNDGLIAVANNYVHQMLIRMDSLQQSGLMRNWVEKVKLAL